MVKKGGATKRGDFCNGEFRRYGQSLAAALRSSVSWAGWQANERSAEVPGMATSAVTEDLIVGGGWHGRTPWLNFESPPTTWTSREVFVNLTQPLLLTDTMAKVPVEQMVAMHLFIRPYPAAA